MGGGDLNTKKSWHPSTFKNQERVWKAERAAEAERRRIVDLRAEMSGERDREQLSELARRTASSTAAAAPAPSVAAPARNDRLGWMYTQPTKSTNSEDYLLGKAIDKNYERLVAEEKPSKCTSVVASKNHVEHEVIPFSIRTLRTGAAATADASADVDAGEAQVDMARKLQEDPLAAIRRRELEARAQLLQNPLRLQKLASLLRHDQAKRKEKKAQKKPKKDKADLDQLLVEKLTKLQDKNIDLASLLAGGESKGKDKSKGKSKSKTRREQRQSESDATPPRRKKKRRRSSSTEGEESKPGRVHARRAPPPAERAAAPTARGLSEREREARLREMMSDAAERDAERARHVARHREESRREERAAARAHFDSEFATRQSARAATASVGERLRANVYNIQRSHGHMETNFARR